MADKAAQFMARLTGPDDSLEGLLKHGNAKIDWLRVERLYNANHTWKHIAYMIDYKPGADKLRAQFHARKQSKRVKEAKAFNAMPWPKVEKCPNRKSSWGPGFAHMNVKERTGTPRFVQSGDPEYFSRQPSSAGW